MKAWQVKDLGERLALAEVADGAQRLGDGVTVGRVAYVAGSR